MPPSFLPPLFSLSPPPWTAISPVQYLQVNSRDKQSEMRSSRSLGDLKGSLLKGGERVRKHSTGESAARQTKSLVAKSLFKRER